MNLNPNAPKNATEVLMLLIAEDTGAFFEPTEAKPQESLENQVRKLIDTFSFGRF